MNLIEKVISVAVLCLLFMGSICSQEDWIKYKCNIDGQFSVLVPGEMTHQSKKVNTAVGELVTLAWTHEGGEDDKNALYLINQVDYPDNTFSKDSTDFISEYLLSAIEAVAESVGGELIYTNELTSLGDIGYLFRIKYNDGNAVIKGKSFIANQQFFMLQVYSSKNNSLNEEMNLFLDSFELHIVSNE